MDYKTFSDEELAKRSQEGDKECQHGLVCRYEDLVHAVVRPFYIPGGEKEDLVQEGRIGLYKAVMTFNGSSSFKTYAYICVRSCVLSALRKVSTKKSAADLTAVSLAGISAEGDYEKNPAVADSEFDPETRYINSETARELSDKIMITLSQSERDILLMRLDGYSYKEIGQKTGRNAKFVDNTVQRIRKKLSRVRGEQRS